MNTFILSNVRIVTPYNIIENGFIYVKRGIIASVGNSYPARVHRSCPMFDGCGCWLLPGIIDICSNVPDEDGSPFCLHAGNRPAVQGVTSVLHITPGLNDTSAHKKKKPGMTRHVFLPGYPAMEPFSIISVQPTQTELDRRGNANPSPADLISCPSMYILCSKDSSLSIIQAVFLLYHHYGLSLTEAVGMATFNPARALGLERKLGSIEWGKIADLVLASESGSTPAVEKVFVSGCLVFSNTGLDQENII